MPSYHHHRECPYKEVLRLLAGRRKGTMQMWHVTCDTFNRDSWDFHQINKHTYHFLLFSLNIPWGFHNFHARPGCSWTSLWIGFRFSDKQSCASGGALLVWYYCTTYLDTTGTKYFGKLLAPCVPSLRFPDAVSSVLAQASLQIPRIYSLLGALL